MIGKICDLYASRGFIHRAARYRFYLDTIFKDIRFDGARVLDVGSGTGIVSCYAKAQGASHVVALEPEGAGGSHNAQREALSIFTTLGMDIELRGETLQTFEAPPASFDVVILHNSINHLDEAACIRLRADPAPYRPLFVKLGRCTRARGQLFVSDCSPHHANPFVRNIEWHKHQPPRKWIALLEEADFTDARVQWTPVLRWPRLARLTANRVVSFFTTSHFSFTMTRR